MVARSSLLVGLFALAVWGQTSDKVFYFAHLDTPEAMQEVVNVVKGAGQIRDVSLDVTKRSLTVKGTADQLGIAGWLAAELDKSGSAAGTRDFPFNDPRAPLAQIIYLSHVDQPRDMQEIIAAVRSVLDMSFFFPMNRQKAIVMRGSAAQVKAADWLLGVLDQPVGSQTSGSPHVYRLLAADWVTRNGDLTMEAAYINASTPQAMQETTNAVRSITDIMRCFPVFSPNRFLMMRGTDDQIELANWLLKELYGAPGQSTQEFKVGGPGNLVAQVAHVNAPTPQSLQETVNAIRIQTKIQRVYPVFYPQRAVAMRGTADQLAQAQQVIQSRQGQ